MESTTSRAGEVVGEKYRLVRLLGEGGMGAVYEARHEAIGRRFAVKFLHAELASHAEILARFRREAQSAGSLENENIAAVTDFGTHQGAPYIVMEFLEGQDLAKVLAQLGTLPVPRAAHILIQVCRGLAAAHARGIVHRDLKPENLLLQQRGDGSDLVKILDFGIAKLKNNEQAGSATRTGITLGTPYYMPPEQARGQKELDERADIYALGVILYEVFSGQKPHNGENYNAILYSILMQAAPRLETFRPDLPPDLCAVVHRAMAADANERFASVSELAQALAPYAGRAITPAPTIGHASTVMAPPSSQLRAMTPGPPAHPALSNSTRAPVALTPLGNTIPNKPSRAPVWIGLSVLVLGGGGAVAWALSRPTPPAEPTAASVPAPAVSVTAAPHIDPTPPAPPVASEAAPSEHEAAPTASATPQSPPAAAAAGNMRPAGRRGGKPPKSNDKSPSTVAPSPPAQPAPAAARPATPRPDDDLFAP
jgi:eukaryotic-like serine/threonine-protein kinase